MSNFLCLHLIVLVGVASLAMPAIQVGDTLFPGIVAFLMSIAILLSADAWSDVFSLRSIDSFTLHGGIANLLFILGCIQFYRNIQIETHLRITQCLAHVSVVLAIMLSEEIKYGRYQFGFYLWSGSHVALLLLMGREVIHSCQNKQAPCGDSFKA